MMLPDDSGRPYDTERYLLDGLYAFWHKLVYEHRLYWPKYTGRRIPWSPFRVVRAVLVWGLVIGFLTAWVIARFF